MYCKVFYVICSAVQGHKVCTFHITRKDHMIFLETFMTYVFAKTFDKIVALPF